jgi:hypothetical protein
MSAADASEWRLWAIARAWLILAERRARSNTAGGHPFEAARAVAETDFSASLASEPVIAAGRHLDCPTKAFLFITRHR